ncbi:ST6B1-like protein [Mya arenaria]|uniref:ST6B1-like protein n=1 Tax=Mya arenaria TaxID=6604 RepID=A0ABY7GBL1_MYAAR|nr:ST6B1-like protein [Mya arenaria]
MEFVKGSVRDAAGNGFDTVTFGDLVLPARFGEQSYEKQLESIKNFQYQDHDIFICSFIKTVPPGSYFNFYKKWKQYLKENNPNIILVHYENLKKNGVAELKRISEFLNVENTDERLGIVGDWKNHFTVAQSEIFDTLEEKFKDDIFTV